MLTKRGRGGKLGLDRMLTRQGLYERGSVGEGFTYLCCGYLLTERNINDPAPKCIIEPVKQFDETPI
jgi:hypothetical protein